MADRAFCPEGALYGVEGVLTSEQACNLGHLVAGVFLGIPITVGGVRESGQGIDAFVGNMPEGLEQKWRSEPMTNLVMIESHEAIVDTVISARRKEYLGHLVVEAGAGDHFAAHDYGILEEANTYFSYLTNEGLHIRRVGMLADMAIAGIRKALNTKGRATFVDFGTGPLPLEKLISTGLSPEEREATQIIAVDTSEDLVRYGLETGLLNKGYVLDVSVKTAEDYQAIIPEADVVAFAEILEHIPHDAVVFRDTVLPWIRSTAATLIGSVPNTVQLAEYRSLLQGVGSPHQLERPIFAPEQDHFSFHTVYTLAKMLRETWGFKNGGIVSNAVRLQKLGNAAHLYAGLDSPMVGDRLVFWAEGA